MHVCFCCARFIFFLYYAKRLGEQNVSKMTYFVWGESKAAIQSINPGLMDIFNGNLTKPTSSSCTGIEPNHIKS